MPRYINDANGRRIRVWTDEEILARYRQGVEDSGGTVDRNAMYTEEDLKAAYEKGSEANDRLVGVAARTGYEAGFQEGEDVGKKHGEQEALSQIQSRFESKKKEGYDAGFEAGSKSKYNDAYAKAYDAAKQSLKEQLASERRTIEDCAIQRYKEGKHFSTRFTEFLDRNRERYKIADLMRKGLGTVGKTPLLPSDAKVRYVKGLPYDQIDALHRRVTHYSWTPGENIDDRIKILRLNDFPTFPVRVASRFSLLYIALPVTAAWLTYKFLLKPKQEKFKTKKEKIKYGETRGQLDTRRRVEKSCDSLDALTPEILGEKQITPAQEIVIAENKKKCAEARSLYASMLHAMEMRRKSNLGNQRYYGPRTTAGHTDSVDNKTNRVSRIHVSSGIADEVSKTVDDLFKSTTNQGSVTREESANNYSFFKRVTENLMPSRKDQEVTPTMQKR